CLPQPLGALPLVSDGITPCVETRQSQGWLRVFVHEAPQRTPSRLARVTWQLDDFWFAEPSQLLHRPGRRIEPADITARQNLPRALDASGEAVTYSGRNDWIEEMRRVKVGNQNLVAHVRIGGILRRVRDLPQVLNLLDCDILHFPACRGDSQRPHQPITARIDQHSQAFVTRGERPSRPSIDQCVRLLMVGQMQSCRTFLSNVIDNEY